MPDIKSVSILSLLFICRRMSAQSIFTDPEKRGLGGTMVRDHSAPILELFHENEVSIPVGLFIFPITDTGAQEYDG